MQIHDVLRRAADHIEAHPAHYDFHCNLVPLDLDAPRGCALGWVGFFSGEYQSPWIYDHYGVEVEFVAYEYLNVKVSGYGPIMSASEFYARMDEICADEAWMHDAKLCAAGLRAYAAMYHPRVPDAIPASVRAIFAPPVAA